jgi:hypothetical protein
VEKFDEYESKSLPPAKEAAKEKEKTKKDFTPLKIMCRFIENEGDPSAYLEAMSVSYPEHPFCQMLITCETPVQFLDKLRSLEQKLPILFREKSKTWLEELFAIIKELKKGEAAHEPGTETESAADHEGAPQPDEATLSQNIPEWIFDLNDSDLKEFMDTLQHDPEFYRYLRFQLKVLEKILYEE